MSSNKRNTLNQITQQVSLILFGSPLEEKNQQKLERYIKHKIETIGVCVLWDRDHEFAFLLSNMGFPSEKTLGKKEFIIYSDSLQYSSNYKLKRPATIRF